ncbi:MAG: aspartate-semialdehyde dehydrogenase, partial [Nitrospirales bacterium]
PHIDEFLPTGYTKEEMKLVHETRKIMGDQSIQVTATTVRVPVYVGHSESVNLETERKLSADEARAILALAPGVLVYDDPAHNLYPMPRDVAGKDEVYVGRIREDDSIPNGLNLWVVADNLRKGAALNAVQIAELLLT